MQSTQFSTTVFLFLKSAKPCVTAAAHTLLCSNVLLIKKLVFKGRGLLRGHSVDLIIREESLYLCTNDNSSQCVGREWGVGGWKLWLAVIFFYCNSDYFVVCLSQ